jgi:hypothetical protein
MILIFDAPMGADVVGELLGAMLARIETGDEVTYAGGALELSTGLFLTGAGDADHRLGKRQTNGFSLHRDDPYFVMGQPPVGFGI